MRFDILGPTRIRLDGERVVSVGGQGMRALLVLLLDAGKVVTTERLVGGLYGTDPRRARRRAAGIDGRPSARGTASEDRGVPGVIPEEILSESHG